MRRILIMGKSSITRLDAPITDSRWEVWTLAWDLVPVIHRAFELHNFWRNFRGNPEDAAFHLQRMQDFDCPVYMRQVEPDVRNSVEYPFDEIAKTIGKGSNGHAYIESSIAAMMALAIYELEAGDKIGIWGCDMGTDTEYAYQRPNMEYLIGFARGKGIKVYVPKNGGALMRSYSELPYGVWETDISAPTTDSYYRTER